MSCAPASWLNCTATKSSSIAHVKRSRMHPPRRSIYMSAACTSLLLAWHPECIQIRTAALPFPYVHRVYHVQYYITNCVYPIRSTTKFLI
jgi:hypothetical protein